MARKRKKTNKNKNRARRRSLPKYTVPRLAILTSMLREQESQQISIPQKKIIKSAVSVRLARREQRFPITIGANPFRRKTKNQSLFAEGIRRATKATTEELNKHHVCQKRKTRKKTLFAYGVAGKGKRRSPGKNRTYQKTSESFISCKG